VILRVLKIVVGVVLALGNSVGVVLYPPNSGERVGFDLAKLAIYWLSAWLIYRGLKPKQKDGSGVAHISR